MANVSKAHPELREGEVFLTNIVVEDVLDGEGNWEEIEHKTKRQGQQAYDIWGLPLPARFKPVFVQQSELVEKGIRLTRAD